MRHNKTKPTADRFSFRTVLRHNHFSRTNLVVLILVISGIGGYVLLTSSAATSSVGDANNDGVVNVTDLSIVLAKYGSTDASADFNQDGTVNITDLSILLSHYGMTVGVGTTVGVPYTCTGPVNNLRIVGTGHDSIALINLKSGCTGSLSFDVTVDPGGGDGLKVQQGAHDLNIGPSRIVCQKYTDTNFHQDGVQVQGGSNVIFHNLTIICPYVTGQGAGGFYIDGKDFSGISNVICDGCNLEHLHYGAFFTGPAPGSGVRNSTIHQGLLTGGYFENADQAPVHDNNTYAPACEGTTASPC